MTGAAVGVFCGSSGGADPAFGEEAAAFGRELVARGCSLVYGGARVGSMGVLADAVLAAGGTAVGVIPDHMTGRELAHEHLTELHVVASMHERKALMAARADAFCALPGGFGTLDELAEILTWAQLGLHAKPVGLLNASGFFDGLLAFFDTAVTHGFVAPRWRHRLVVGATPGALLDALLAPGGSGPAG